MSEPPINRNPDDLDPEFRRRLAMVLGELALRGTPFKFHEGFRTVQRQQWLYAQGRTRAGERVTDKNGTTNRSNHQGTGRHAGSGRAADCYPIGADGKVVLEPPEATWELYARTAEENGLVAGHRWKTPHDSPHVELKA